MAQTVSQISAVAGEMADQVTTCIAQNGAEIYHIEVYL